MPNDLLGNIVGAGMVGVSLSAILVFLVNRRKTGSDVNVATFTTLRDMNQHLTSQFATVQTQLDTERAARRSIEDELLTERRARRQLEDELAAEQRARRQLEGELAAERSARHALEERVAALERRSPDPEGGSLA